MDIGKELKIENFNNIGAFRIINLLPCPGLLEIIVLFRGDRLVGQHLKCLPILLVLVGHNIIEDTDGGEAQISYVAFLVHNLIKFTVYLIGFILTPFQDTLNLFISQSTFLCLQNDTGSKLEHTPHIFSLEFAIGFIMFRLLNDKTVPFKFNHLSLNYFLLNCVLSYQTIHIYILLLTDSMCTVHCLKVVLRIPVRVINYYSVCHSQVDTHSTCFCCN